MKIHCKKIKGGYKFRNFEGSPEPQLVQTGIPGKVIIPLKQGFGKEVKPTVKIGDKVRAGQIIGIDKDVISGPVHSSVNGTVTDLTQFNYFKREINAVVIKSDGTSEWDPIHTLNGDWQSFSTEQIEEAIYMSGVASLDRAGIPTRFKSSVVPPSEITDIVIQGVDFDVYNTSLEVLLDGKRMLNFIEGLKILHRIMPDAKVHLVFNKKHKGLMEQLYKLTIEHKWIKMYKVEDKYPIGFDEILLPAVLNKKFPYGFTAANIGVNVLSIQTILKVYEAVVEGKPLIDRIIAICGPGFKTRNHQHIRVGTPLSTVVKDNLNEDHTQKLISNSILNGRHLSDLNLPVDRLFHNIIALPNDKSKIFLNFISPGFKRDSFSNTFAAKTLPTKHKANTNLHGEMRPCVFCGFCQDVCPVGLIPHLIHKYTDRAIIDDSLMRLRTFNCIDCNLCSYVCPSKVNLAQVIKKGKELLTNKGYDSTSLVKPYFNLKGFEEYRGIK